MQDTTQAKWTLRGVIEAPVSQVWETLLEGAAGLTPADRQQIAREVGPQRFTNTSGPGGGKLYVAVDKQRHTLALQGEWWYRGVYTVEPHAQGSLLVYRVYNIAPGPGRWLVPLVHRAQNYDAQIRRQFQQMLQAIGARLGCATHLATQ